MVIRWGNGSPILCDCSEVESALSCDRFWVKIQDLSFTSEIATAVFPFRILRQRSAAL